MKIGFYYFATDYSMPIVEVARALEEHGYESLFVPERRSSYFRAIGALAGRAHRRFARRRRAAQEAAAEHRCNGRGRLRIALC
jgi:hypothetical protein